MEDGRDQSQDPSIPAPVSNSVSPPAPQRERGGDQSGQDYDGFRGPSPDVAGALFSEYPSDAAADNGLDRVMEIPLTIHVELGRKRVKIRELMQVGAGTVLTLDLQAGAPLSIYANQTLIAEGEAVVVGERYGVRVTDIVSPAERVRRLGGDE